MDFMRGSRNKKPRSQEFEESEKPVFIPKIYTAAERWLYTEHAKIIRTPDVKEVPIEKVKKKLLCKSICRARGEVKRYVSKIDLKFEALTLDWAKGPPVEKCTNMVCDCICKEDMLLPYEEIPRDYSQMRCLRWFWKLYNRFDKSKPKNSLAAKLAADAEVEVEVYNKLVEKDLLEKFGPEFCLSRCTRFFSSKDPQSKLPICIRYFLKGFGCTKTIKVNPLLQEKRQIRDEIRKLYEVQKKAKEAKKPENAVKKKIIPKEIQPEDDRVCYDSLCTVSTQSRTNPDGQFIIGKYSHLLFGTASENVLKDIEGTKLSVFNYKDDPLRSASLDKRLIAGIKSRISKIQSEIYKSIVESQRPIRSISRCTQYEYGDFDENDRYLREEIMTEQIEYYHDIIQELSNSSDTETSDSSDEVKDRNKVQLNSKVGVKEAELTQKESLPKENESSPPPAVETAEDIKVKESNVSAVKINDTKEAKTDLSTVIDTKDDTKRSSNDLVKETKDETKLSNNDPVSETKDEKISSKDSAKDVNVEAKSPNNDTGEKVENKSQDANMSGSAPIKIDKDDNEKDILLDEKIGDNKTEDPNKIQKKKI